MNDDRFPPQIKYIAGNLLTAYVSAINQFHGATYFLFFAASMAGLSFVFV